MWLLSFHLFVYTNLLYGFILCQVYGFILCQVHFLHSLLVCLLLMNTFNLSSLPVGKEEKTGRGITFQLHLSMITESQQIPIRTALDLLPFSHKIFQVSAREEVQHFLFVCSAHEFEVPSIIRIKITTLYS